MRGRAPDEFESKRHDYWLEDAFFSEPVTDLAPYEWVDSDLRLWIDDYPDSLRGRRILEIGASEGLFGVYVAEHYEPEIFVVSDVIGRRMIAARRKADTLAGRLQVEAGSSYALPHADGAFDVVLCNGALCHMPELDRVVGEIKRVLAPGGTYFGREPNFHNPLVAKKTLYGPWASPNMVPVYPRDLKREFTAAGFEVRIALFWRRFPWVRGKYFAVSQRIRASLPG